MKTITFGTRTFCALDVDRRTVLQDQYLRAALIRSGLDRHAPSPNETNEAFVARCVAVLRSSGRAHEVLSALLLPVGAEFDVINAEMTAEYLAALDDQDSRERIQNFALYIFFSCHAEQLHRFRKRSLSAFASRRNREFVEQLKNVNRGTMQ